MSWLLPLAVALVLSAVPQPWAAAQAQSTSVAMTQATTADIEARREVLFRRMLANPGDLDAAFEYAMLSIQVNDLEAAVSTLERMLIFSPGLARVQLELGVLYYRLGAYASARAYLEAALASPNVPADVQGNVQLYLEQIKLEADPAAISGSIFSGVRWQSNANTGPGARDITLNGLTFTLDEQATGQPDWSIVNVATLHLVHDLKRQGDLLEANVVAYSGRYREQHQVNLEFVESNFGPSFNMKRYGLDKTRLFLYGIAEYARLDDSQYFGSVGYGVRLVSHGAERATMEVRAERRHRDYNDTDDRPTSSLRDGMLTRADGTYAYRISGSKVLSLQAYAQREDVDADFFSNHEFGASVGLAYVFPGLFRHHRAFRNPWLLQLGAGAARRKFDAPDPTINALEIEVDEIWWARSALVIPVGDRWALIPQVDYRDQQSNYDTRVFDNLTAMVGAQWRF